jgi:hypothetical protein
VHPRSRTFDAMKVDVMNESVRQVVESRNVVVHHAGHVSQQYLDACSPTRYRIGDRIVVSEWYLRKALSELAELSLEVTTACRENTDPGSRSDNVDIGARQPKVTKPVAFGPDLASAPQHSEA